MSSRYPTSVGFSLETLACRGGRDGPHKDGWGVAYYEGRDAFLLREPRPAEKTGRRATSFCHISARQRKGKQRYVTRSRFSANSAAAPMCLLTTVTCRA
jgi:predicted glutamine amidotransferase